ncbi:MAG: hypothetical protein JST06_01990 [Bacteroidetes bacterium]|nr:hypothetical protein [Bacteroidota bacterium]MBS1630092.1 hypothetical protein [Bacteroidota bacterium]
MHFSRGFWAVLGLVILVICLAWFWGNPLNASQPANMYPAHLRRENRPENLHAIDSALHLLHDGDLALRTGADATSVMLRQMNQQDKRYSHCGIVFFEQGYPFVYHSIGGEDNPDERLRRDSASFFFNPKSNERLGIARLQLSPGQVVRLHQIVRRYWLARIPFDMDFDLATDDRFYCAEFVYKAVREAARDTGFFPLSHLLKKTYVGVDDLYENPHARLVCDVRYLP